LTQLILASQSPARILMLKNAGLSFDAKPAPIDERAVEAPLIAGGRKPGDLALALAEAKAIAVSVSEPTATVIGADQTLEADGMRWTKPRSVDEAREQLERLGGRVHCLHSGVAVARAGGIVWRHLDTARLTMRQLSASFIDSYLAGVGDAALASVGTYQVEGIGIQLFERIEGDFFTILGLPLLPLLSWLRSEKVIPT
jgi:septum formation protein